MALPISDLAWRNLVHDKVRLAVTIVGIVFAVVLIVVQLGLFLGFTMTTSHLVDRSGADLWVMAPAVPYIEVGVPFSERKLSSVLATPGVRDAGKYLVRFSQWQRPDGRQESVLVVGVDPDRGLGGPWNLVEGRLADLKLPDAVFVDELYKDKLGVSRIGDRVELRGHRARVTGFTRGIRSFTTSPYVFASFKNAQNYTGLEEDRTLFLLVTADPGVSIDSVRRHLMARLSDVDVLTSAEFSRMTRVYWMFTTGAGVALLLAALLGLVVGVVVVTQTIYATTVDHLAEYGTLKAMGATNGYLYRVILEQAALSAVIGYGLGLVVGAVVVRASERGGAVILLPPWLAVATFVLTVAMCVIAAVVSINKVTRLDPAMVFKG